MSRSYPGSTAMLLALAVSFGRTDMKSALQASPDEPGKVAQPPAIDKNAPPPAPFKLHIDAKAQKALETAKDCVQREAWQDALKALQSILDAPEDSLVRVQGIAEKSKEDLYVSARSEADRLIESLPVKAKEVYEQLSGAEASRRLGEAKKSKNDQTLLAAVVRRYRHTEAGLEALKLLTSETSKAGSKPADGSGWPMFGGNPARSAHSQGSAPILEGKWNLPMHWCFGGPPKLAEQWVNDAVKDAVKISEERHIPILPAFFPIAATIQMDGKPTPLLVFRSYYGIHAVNSQNGKLHWEQPSMLSIDFIVRDPQRSASMGQWVAAYSGSSPNPLLTNSMLGCLSTDSVNVYAVEDLALPPHPNFMMQMQLIRNRMNFGVLDQYVRCNRLQAFELDSGKIKWELGGPGSDYGEFGDSYFLGPPLPLGQRLYVLNEKDGEIRLVCLDPAKSWNDGENPLLWKLRLGTVRDKLEQDPGRRIQAAHISHTDGILVCPTNAGYVLGVDLRTQSLLWAHSYRTIPAPEATEDIRRMMAAGLRQPRLSSESAVSAPVIQEGKVVVIAPDCPEIICIKLRDGTNIWKAARNDDLFLGGVYNDKVLLVDKKGCRALSLADGKQLWRLETGSPSGRGTASDNVYYMPLKAAVNSGQPAIFAIDIDKGLILSKNPFRRRPDGQAEIPGNLLFFAGDMISQNVDAVTAYPLLSTRVNQINDRLKKNPRDPAGLAGRGEWRLIEKDWQGASEDLRAALANKPPVDILPKARGYLFEALTQLLQQDFNASEKFLDEFKELSQAPIHAGASAEEAQQAEIEQERRRSIYWTTVSMGRERQGRLVEALQAYLPLAALPASRTPGISDLIDVPGEVGLKARRYVWSRGRISSLLAKSGKDQDKLQDEIARQWEAAHNSKDAAKLRDFLGSFGLGIPKGKEACLELADRLIKQGNLLEAELLLLSLRHQDDPHWASSALLALAGLMVQERLWEDAGFYYRALNHDFGKVVIRDGKTGADFYDEAANDKRLLVYLEDPGLPWRNARIKAREVPGTFRQPVYSFVIEGESLPFFQHHRLSLSLIPFQITLNENSGEARWRHVLADNPTIQNVLAFDRLVHFPSIHLGHLVVFSLGNIYALDPLERKILWERPGLAQVLQLAPSADGRIFLPTSSSQRIGKLGPVQPSYCCLQTPDGLEAVDPLSGTVLWRKGDVSSEAAIFGDDQYVFLVDVRGGAVVEGSSRVLRAQDGTLQKSADWAALYQRRLGLVGRHVLLSETDAQGGITLRLHDLLSGQDLWKKTFTANALVIRCHDSTLAGVAEPGNEGKVTLVDSWTGRELLTTRINVHDLDKVSELRLFSDRNTYYLAVNKPSEGAQQWRAGPWSPVWGGVSSAVINGKIYAFDRTTGKLHWFTTVVDKVLVLDQFDSLPVLLFVALNNRGMNPRAAGHAPVTIVTSFDKRSGKLLLNKEYVNNDGNQFFALNVNLKEGRVELVRPNLKIVHSVEE